MARQNFVGMVVSHGKMDKTIKVRVQRIKFNKLVNKNVVRFTDFLVHDEANKCKEGDVVRIEYVRPLSARKSFSVTEILKNKGLSWIKYREDAPAVVAAEELRKVTQYKRDRESRLGLDGTPTVSEQLDVLRTAYNTQNFVPEHARTEEQKEAVAKVIAKYTPDGFLPSFASGPLYDLPIDKLRAELKALDGTIEQASFSKHAAAVLRDEPARADAILRAMGKIDPSAVPRNIKKNLLMKYFVKTLGEQKQEATA
ncbi:mitochondrial 37S ribosomal protein uS17m [Magnusiomyces paraingens]|uniref:Uncharacterized protein n=1 Tax=Magnusiomyces paraingens TaxID=2606893 RepID=A0A5E8C609_9ASCO|nr:uncharacterized protein SAPINGB_P006260 [Saprochaete ingens]VVT58540.1 unnamed protein product [Saprochaete ingens]